MTNLVNLSTEMMHTAHLADTMLVSYRVSCFVEYYAGLWPRTVSSYAGIGNFRIQGLLWLVYDMFSTTAVNLWEYFINIS